MIFSNKIATNERETDTKADRADFSHSGADFEGLTEANFEGNPYKNCCYCC